MDGSPRGQKRSYVSIDEQAAPEDLPAPTSKSSPIPQTHDSAATMKTPMPLHHPTAGLLRTQSPLMGQHLLSLPILFNRASTPLARTLDAPLPHSYGSSVSLDPASLSPIPDPVAVAEIQRFLPQILRRAGYKDVVEMASALEADVASTMAPSAGVEASTQGSNQVNDGISKGYTAEMAGAEFDAFLSQMADQDLQDSPIAGQQTDPEKQ